MVLLTTVALSLKPDTALGLRSCWQVEIAPMSHSLPSASSPHLCPGGGGNTSFVPTLGLCDSKAKALSWSGFLPQAASSGSCCRNLYRKGGPELLEGQARPMSRGLTVQLSCPGAALIWKKAMKLSGPLSGRAVNI